MTKSSLDKVLSKVCWRLFPLMMLLYLVNYLDRINISYAGPSMEASLGFKEDSFGLGAGLFFIGYFLSGVPSNLLLARFGAKKWIAAITIGWGFVSMSMSLVNNMAMFCFIRILLGITEAGFFPGMILYLTYWFSKREHAKAVARFMTAIPLAGIAGGVISSRILLMHGVLGLPGWKWLFIITGAPALLLGLVVLFAMSDSPARCPWLSAEEKECLESEIKKDQEALAAAAVQNQAQALDKAQSVFVDLKVWHLSLIYFSMSFTFYGFQIWLPQILMSYGSLSDDRAALLSSIPALFQAMGMVLVAAHSDKKHERRIHLAASATFSALCILICMLCHNVYLALTCLCISAFGIWGTVGPFWAMPTAYLRGSSAAAGIAMINSFGSLGGFSGTYLFGLIKKESHDFSHSLLALAVSLLVAAFLTMLLKQSPQTK